MKNFSEKERLCETAFDSGEPYWHAYTSGKDTPIIFVNDEELTFAMNAIAFSANLFPRVRIIAFQLMNNHFHFVVSARMEDIHEFWMLLQKKLVRFFPVLSRTAMNIKPIVDLRSLRNNIVYTNRNGYVANPDFTPFSYPWGTGRYYFMDWPDGRSMSEITFDGKRKMFRCRTPQVPDEWHVTDGYVTPCAYCSIKFGISMFRDAHHYFAMVSKNIESYKEVATDIDDSEFLTDAEMFAQISKTLGASYGASALKELSRSQKFDIALTMRRDWHASNGQIKRILGLSQYEVDSIFPLSASR